MYTAHIAKGHDCVKMLEECIRSGGGLSNILGSEDEKILIKPNFGCHKTALTGATTDLRVLRELIEILQGEGYSNVVVADGAMAGYIKIDIMKHLGVCALCKKYGVPTRDLNRDEGISHRLVNGAIVEISRTVLESKVINLAKLKTHVLTTVTLGIKNLMGCVVGFDKREIHLHGLDDGLADLSGIIKPAYTIIEGLIGMEGRGPVAGNPIRADVIVGSTDVIVADIVASKIMGFDPFTIRHIRDAVRKSGRKYTMDQISVTGTSLSKAVVPFERADPKGLEANQYFDRIKHTIRGNFAYNFVCALLSFKLGSTFARVSGILQEELNHKTLENPPKVNKDLCRGCGHCKSVCPVDAVSIEKGKAEINWGRCVKCYCCLEICPYNAVVVN